MNAMANPQTYRILIADDEQNILNAYSSVLHADAGQRQAADDLDDLESELFGVKKDVGGKQRYELVLCQQGQQAVSAVRQAAAAGERFSVAFLDVRMPPGISGVETAKEIRAIDPDLHIVFVTAYSDTDPRRIATIVPPIERLFYVAKPFQALELQQFASALSNKWKAEQDLSVAHEELKQQYRALQDANHDLVGARRKAESANRMKTEFMANVSHELRTPLNSIIGFSEIMINQHYGPMPNERYRSYVHDIFTSGSHLLGIVSDILDISKIEVGEMDLLEDTIEIPEIVETALRLVGAKAETAKVSLRAELAPDLPLLFGDPRRIKQILLNLLSNAIKFTGDGGTVTVRAERVADGGLWMAIVDTGIGIAAADLERAMAPFSQVDSKLSRQYEGTGLGLPIAKSLTELHGGTLSLVSHPGRGTTVTLRFPPDRLR
jgi:two-component system, cell cycle sensor histidine kinase PleC